MINVKGIGLVRKCPCNVPRPAIFYNCPHPQSSYQYPLYTGRSGRFHRPCPAAHEPLHPGGDVSQYYLESSPVAWLLTPPSLSAERLQPGCFYRKDSWQAAWHQRGLRDDRPLPPYPNGRLSLHLRDAFSEDEEPGSQARHHV